MSVNEEAVNITPPDFLNDYHEEEYNYALKSLDDSLNFLTKRASYFTKKYLISVMTQETMLIGTKEPEKKKFQSKAALEKYEEEKKKAEKKRKFVFDLMGKPSFDDLVEYLIEKFGDLVELEGTNEVTTREMLEKERKMIALSMEQTSEHCLDETIVNNAINARKGISEEQSLAVLACCRTNDRVTVVEGTAGAGKSFTMAAVKKAFIDSGYKIIGTALSWNAAAVLSASTGIDDCTAIEGLTIDIRKAQDKGLDYFRQKTVLIVDEAGLVGTRHMVTLLEMTRNSPHPIKVVLTGDSFQLNPVDAGNSLEAIVHYHGTTRIDTIRRQKQNSHRVAVKNFSFRKSGVALNTFVQQEAVHWCKNKREQFNMVVRDFLSYKIAFPNKRPLILALSNDDVTELNKMVRVAYKKMGLVYGSETRPIKVTDGRKIWENTFAIGDEVVVRANSKKTIVYNKPDDINNMDRKTWVPQKVGVFNRNSGRIVAVEESKTIPGSYDLVIDMDGDISGRMVLNTKDFEHDSMKAFPVVHNFAMTIYGSQGQTVQKVFMIDSDKMDFRLAYVGMSRHTDSVTMYLNETGLHNRMDIQRGLAKPDQLKQLKKRVEEIPVELGRYYRHEMLNTVSASWGHEKNNKTAMMHSYEKKNKKAFTPKEEKENIIEVKGEDNGPDVIDFDSNRYVVKAGDDWISIAKEMGIIEDLSTQEDVNKLTKWVEDVKKFSKFEDSWDLESGDILFLSERLNLSYPTIDLEKLFQLDDIEETHLEETADIESKNIKYKEPEMPLSEEYLEKKEKGKVFEVDEKGGFFSMFFKSKDKEPQPQEEESLADYNPLGEEVKLNEKEQKEYDKLAKKKIKPVVQIPFVEEKEKVAYLDRKGRIAYTDGSTNGATTEFMDQIKGKFWGEGKNYEPRVFATNGRTILSRYDLEGNCVVGQGFPPTFLNSKSNKAPFLIVPGAKEYFWMFNYALNKFKENKDIDKLSNVIWGAKDVDWGLFFKEGNDYSARTRIARGQDPNNIEWAVNLQKKLWEKNHVKIQISPAIEGHNLPWENSVEPQPEISRRRFGP